jgi:hypothetical protein
MDGKIALEENFLMALPPSCVPRNPEALRTNVALKEATLRAALA